MALTDERLRYVRTVLRLRPGDRLELFDGKGRLALATVESADRRAVVLAVEAPEAAPDNEASVPLTLLFGVPKGDGAGRIIRAGTELGVGAFVPVLTARTVPKGSDRQQKRWQRIAAEAARQCGRAVIPAVAEPTHLARALAALPTGVTLRLVPWEDETTVRFVDCLPAEPPGAAALLIGPEGGLTAEEVAQARAAGFVSVSLGPRILRATTASIAACALLLHRLGDLG